MQKFIKPIVFACVTFLAQCSFLKLDKETNCLNDKAGCFREDKTRPRVQSFVTQPALDGANSLSELQHIDVTFSEEIKNGEQAATYRFKASAGHNFTVTSVQKQSIYTYRLIVSGSLQSTGLVELDIAPLKDYNDNAFDTAVPVDFTGNVNIPIRSSVNHNGVSTTGGYASIDLKFYHEYTADITNANNYQVWLTSGAIDCSGTPLTSGSNLAPGAPGTPEEILLNVPAASFSPGMNRLVVCISNANNPNAANRASHVIIYDDDTPTLSFTPAGGSYKDPATILLTCSNNADKIAYTSTTQQGLTPPADPAPPTFDPATGNIVTGLPYGSILGAANPVNPTYTKFIWRCINIAGNLSTALVAPVQYYIDSTIPGVAVNLGTYRRYLSAINPTTSLTFSTDQTAKAYSIRRNGTTCDGGGDGVELATGVTDVTPGVTTTVPLDITTHFTTMNTNYPVRICVAGTGIQWGTAYLEITRDDTVPTITPSVVSGSYGALQSVQFTCDDSFGSVHRVAYKNTAADGLTVPALPTAPVYNTATGDITDGLEQTTTLSPDDRKTTRYTFSCIDRAGNVAVAGNTQYTIDATLPIVNFVSLSRTAVSGNAGAYTDTTFTFTSTRANLVYRIRRVANCDHTGTPGETIASGTITTASANNPVVLPVASFPANGVTYPIRACVYNLLGASSHQTTAVNVTRDNTAPTFAGLTSLSSSGSGNFTLNWSAATDGAGSGIAYYNIYRADNLGGPYVSAQHMAAHPATSINVTVPVATNTYYYVAGAVDNAGNETKVTVAELATKPTISVTMISELSNTNFTLSDGTASAPLTATTATMTAAWSTTLSAGSTYNFSISNVPAGKICSIRQRQFGILSANINITIDCIIGYMVGGRYQSVPAAPLNYMLYRGTSSTTYSGGTAINGMAMIGNMLFFVRRESATDSSILKCNMTNCAGTLVTVVSTTAGLIRHLATDGANLYAANPNGSAATMRIQKYSALLTGQAAPQAEIDPGLSVGYHSGLALDANRNLLYVGVRGAAEIKRIHLDTGVVDTLSSIVSQHEGLALVGDDLYAATPDGGNCILRAASAHTASALSLFAGSCGVTESYADGSLTEARFARAHGLVSDGTDLYVSEFAGNRIRRINLRKGIVSTIAGGGGSGTDGTGPIAGFASLFAMSTDGRRLLASEGGTARLRTVVDDGLVGYWPLNATTADYASAVTTNYALSATGGFTNPSGRYNETNGSYRFDGSNYLEVADQNQYDLSSEYTISVWINRNAAGVMRIVDKATANNCDGYNFDITSDNRLRLLYCIVNGVGQDVVSGTAVPVNQWVHVLGTFSGTRQQARLYINGHLDAEKSTGAGVSLTNALSVRLGMDHSGANGFSGAMADVRLYNRVLSEGEINELAQDALSTQVGASYNTGATGLLTHYDFNAQGATPSLTDRGPMGLNLTALNSPAAHSGKDGDTAGAFYLNSTNQYLTNSTTTGLPMSAHPRTLCGWIKPASYPAANTGHILVSYSGTTRSQLGLGNYSGSQGVDYHSNDNLVHIPYTVPLNTWSHLCAAYTGTQVSLYVNGSLLGTQAAVSNSAFGATGTFVGAQPNVAYLAHGGVDDVRIYNHTLSAAQIRQLATQVPAGLMARYDFNGDNVDSSGFANTMTATGSPVADNDRYLQTNSSYRFNGGKFGTATPIMTSLDNVSLSAWFKQTAMHSWLQYIVINGGGGDGYGIFLDGPAGNVVSAILGGVGYLRTTVAAPLHVWNHVALVRSAGTWSIYLNGASLPINAIMPATITSTPTLPSGGAYIGLDSGSGNYFEGAIDDARFYNRALSATEIRALAGYHPMQVSTWNATPGSSSMKLHYIPENVGALADGATITQWDDVSGHSMHLFQGTPGSRPQYAQSGINNRPAVNFNSNRIFTRPCNDTNLGGDNTTIIGAIRQTSNSGANKGLFEYGQKLIYLNGGGSQTFSYVRLGPDELKITSLPDFINLIAPNPNMIYSVSHSLAGGAIYKNGSNVTNGTPAASASQVCSTTGLYFGGRNGYDNFEGLFGDFLYFSTILSSADRRIAECYLSSKYSVPLDNSVTCD